MVEIKYLTIHAAATFPSMDTDISDVKQWHLQRGFKDVGYHYFIKRDGTVQKGRPDNVTGAHVGGHNTGNLGVCMAGGLKEGTQKPEDNYTEAQWESLNKLLMQLLRKYPKATIMGHNGFSNHKSRGCPCFDWHTYREWLMGVKKSLYMPDDWYTFDWHMHSSDDFNLPEDFYEAVEKE